MNSKINFDLNYIRYGDMCNRKITLKNKFNKVSKINLSKFNEYYRFK